MIYIRGMSSRFLKLFSCSSCGHVPEPRNMSRIMFDYFSNGFRKTEIHKSSVTSRATASLSGQRATLQEAVKCLKNSETSKREYSVTGDIICPSQVMGIDHLHDPRLNKGLGFTLEERQALGIHGLQPARFKSQEEQVELCRISVMSYQENLNRFLYMTELHDRNEKLFFRLLSENIEMLMPIVYTPTVGLACQKCGLIYRRPRGLFITLNDRGHIFEVLKNWPEPNVRAIVVTDGERILGLGDLGACGMGIPVGKMALYTALAGIKPHHCLPITLDVGTNSKALLEDPLYVGLRQPRLSGAEYDSFVDEFMEAAVKRYGQHCLIQFEDFGNHNAFRYLDKYRGMYCTFNDDIQGTAGVVVSGLLAAQRVTGKKISQQKFLFLGAGEASIGIADLCVQAMQLEGLSLEDARQRVWLVDIDGLLAKGRPEGKLEGHKAYYAKDHKPVKSFASVVTEIKPSVLIGASTVAGAFTPEILKNMASFNDKPIIFALSNPTDKAECTAEQAYTNTDGRCIFASGSPFPPFAYKGTTFYPGQGNNAYIFPGVALGVILAKIHHIKEELFLLAAQTVANHVSDEDIKKGRLYPPLNSIRECSVDIAEKILTYSYQNGIATVYPEPKDKKAYVMQHQYNYHYEPSLPVRYKWPKGPDIKTRPIEPTKLMAK